jgi:hypothetical protein
MSLTTEDKNFFKDLIGQSHGVLHSDMMSKLKTLDQKADGISEQLKYTNGKVGEHEKRFHELDLTNRDRDHQIRVNTARLENSSKLSMWVMQGVASTAGVLLLGLLFWVLVAANIVKPPL